MFKKLTTFLTLVFIAACSDGLDRSNYTETPAAPAPRATAPASPTKATGLFITGGFELKIIFSSKGLNEL